MREIKFRGIRIDNGKWVYGELIAKEYPVFLRLKTPIILDISGAWEVDINTIGQYTGLKDKNGVEIYEGDIVHCREYGFGKIEWNEEDACFYFYAVYECGFDKENIYDYLEDMEVIGNKYENLELLIVGGGVSDY